MTDVRAQGLTRAGLGNKTRTIACAEKATGLLSLKPDAFPSPYVMEDVADIYARTRKPQEALNILKKLPGPEAGEHGQTKRAAQLRMQRTETPIE